MYKMQNKALQHYDDYYFQNYGEIWSTILNSATTNIQFFAGVAMLGTEKHRVVKNLLHTRHLKHN